MYTYKIHEGSKKYYFIISKREFSPTVGIDVYKPVFYQLKESGEKRATRLAKTMAEEFNRESQNIAQQILAK